MVVMHLNPIAQLKGAVATWYGQLFFHLLFLAILKATIGLRVTEEEEMEGLDVS